MSGAKKKILITAIIAVAVVAAATLCFFIAVMFMFNNEAALCDYLNKNGVTQEELSMLISGAESVADTFEGDKQSYDKGVNALYALAVKADKNKATVEGAVNAYFNAPLISNPFSMMKYSSVLQQVRPLIEKLSSETSSEFTENEIKDSVTQMLAICEGIAAAGKNSFDEAAKTLYTALKAENLNEDVSYKSLINLALYAVDVTEKADFSKAYVFTDAILGEGFSDRYSGGIKSAAVVLRSADYDTLLTLSGYLPDTGNFAAAVCNYAVSVQGFDKTAFCDAFTAAVNTLYKKKDIDAALDTVKVAANFNALANADPDALTEQDKAQIKSAAEYFKSALSVFKEQDKE